MLRTPRCRRSHPLSSVFIAKLRWPGRISCPAQPQPQTKSTKTASFLLKPLPVPLDYDHKVPSTLSQPSTPSPPTPLTKNQSTNDEIHDHSGCSAPLRFYDHPRRTSQTCHQGCLGSQDLLSNCGHRMACWGNPPRQMGSRPETRERHEPRRESPPVQERALGPRCVNPPL